MLDFRKIQYDTALRIGNNQFFLKNRTETRWNFSVGSRLPALDSLHQTDVNSKQSQHRKCIDIDVILYERFEKSSLDFPMQSLIRDFSIQHHWISQWQMLSKKSNKVFTGKSNNFFLRVQLKLLGQSQKMFFYSYTTKRTFSSTYNSHLQVTTSMVLMKKTLSRRHRKTYRLIRVETLYHH